MNSAATLPEHAVNLVETTFQPEGEVERVAAPTRVCFVIDRLSRAGTESQLLLLIRKLDRTRVMPYLVLLDGHDEQSRLLMPTDCSTLALGVRRLTSLQALLQARTFYRLLRRERIDVVQTYFPDSTRYAAPIAKAAGVRLVFGARRNIGHWVTRRDRWLGRLYNRWFIDKIVANCEAARKAVIEQEGAKPAQVVVLPNLIDLDRFRGISPWTPKPAGTLRRVGMVGNLRPVKGVDLFIRAAAEVIREFPRTEFAIAGGGDATPYSSLIKELGIADRVSLLGPVDDVPAFLATLDVAVLPSRAEGLSNSLLEYMAAGRPIVATDVGQTSAVLEGAARDCCVAPEDIAALTQGILRWFKSPEAARRCAQSLASRAKEASGWDAANKLYHTGEG